MASKVLCRGERSLHQMLGFFLAAFVSWRDAVPRRLNLLKWIPSRYAQQCDTNLDSMATLMFLAGGLLATTCVAQQFEGAPSSLSFPGLSVDCTHAINTIIKCPSWFEGLRNGQALLHRTQLEDLCADPCTESLGAVKRAILEGCTEDAVIVEDDIAYPATYLVDQYIHGQARYCQVDP